MFLMPVSYTHLDVYKRQGFGVRELLLTRRPHELDDDAVATFEILGGVRRHRALRHRVLAQEINRIDEEGGHGERGAHTCEHLPSSELARWVSTTLERFAHVLAHVTAQLPTERRQ